MGRITEVTVGYGVTFNDPYEQYRNHRPSVTLKWEVDDGDPQNIIEVLEARAVAEVEKLRSAILAQRAKEECTCMVCGVVDADDIRTMYVRRKTDEQPKQTKLCGVCAAKVDEHGEISF